jgi:hypothetical protein
MPRRLTLVVMLLGGLAGRSRAQAVAFETLGAVQMAKTDAGSRLLALNDGNPVIDGQLYGWFAYQPANGLRLMAVGEVYGVTGHDSELAAELQLLSLRWWRSRAARVELGKILLPIGEFASRRFANVNPLIGQPDTYVDEYPWGVSLTGAAGHLDYTAAVVSLPAVNVRYTPEPGSRMRPMIGMGITAGPRLHVGAAVTYGSYLNADLDDQLPAGTSWQDFRQTVATADVRYSVGRLDTRGEAVWSSYQVPTVANAVHGLGWYLEPRLTISPRLFLAARYEHNRYPFVQPINPGFWVGTATTQMNGEVGLGYRLSPDALVKTSLRVDHWPVHELPGVTFPDGYALAVQLSLHSDIVQLFTRKP